MPDALAKPARSRSVPLFSKRSPIILPFAVSTSCDSLSMVANTRRALIASYSACSLNCTPDGTSTPVRLV